MIKELIGSGVKTPADLASFKRKAAKKYGIDCPSNISLLKAYHKLAAKGNSEKSERLLILLKTRPVRSLSGIVNISVLTKPYPCPGRCLYCPAEKGIPKSYVSGEPAVERAKNLKYDPYSQVKKRIEMLESEGHPTDKIELRIVGGTWSYYPRKYQEWFVKRCLDACNEAERGPNSRGKSDLPKFHLQNVQRQNETTKHRIVGLSVETRPDFITLREIKWLRELGVTMVELGVQSIYDDILESNQRGHGVKEIISATKTLKDSGFKVLYQVMPNLFGSSLKRDEKMFEIIFKNQDFQPDMLKIYPCAVLKSAGLYSRWRKGEYKPYPEKQLISLLKLIKQKIPPYARIQRITRDIPSKSIVEGPAKISNMRQILADLAKKENWRCNCIRCREVKNNYKPKEKICLFRKNYLASGGKEIFLSFENKNKTQLYSLLRLRAPSCLPKIKENGSPLFPGLANAAVIREIHTYGPQMPIGESAKSVNSPQHKGLGKKLIKEAEKIVNKEFGIKKIAVIAAVGAREYFRTLGYKLENTYMVKKL